jgi:hypothetical protein
MTFLAWHNVTAEKTPRLLPLLRPFSPLFKNRYASFFKLNTYTSLKPAYIASRSLSVVLLSRAIAIYTKIHFCSTMAPHRPEHRKLIALNNRRMDRNKLLYIPLASSELSRDAPRTTLFNFAVHSVCSYILSILRGQSKILPRKSTHPCSTERPGNQVSTRKSLILIQISCRF